MVNARLHIICGNCGGTDFTFEIHCKKCDYEENKEYFLEENMPIDHPDIDLSDNCVLSCENCGTLHFLDSYITMKKG